jgi:hypothetical protein
MVSERFSKLQWKKREQFYEELMEELEQEVDKIE